MKKIFLIPLISANCINFSAQNSFGIITYPQPNAILSSGKAMSAGNSGFLVSSYFPQATATTANFSVDRLDVGGAPGVAPTFFQNDYQITNFAVGCPATAPQIVNTFGCQAIELVGSAASYGVVVITDVGLVYTALNSSGGVSNYGAGYFPGGIASPSARPVLVQYTPTDGYCATSANGILYLQKIMVGSAIFSSGLGYQVVGSTLLPTAILIEPYTGNDYITIVGYIANASAVQNGFFMQVNRNTFAVTTFIEYDQTAGPNTDNTFQCMTLDNTSVGGAPRFLIGGNSESILCNPGKAWMLKLDRFGGVVWSSVIDGSTNPTSGKIHAVFQRFSTAYNRYENYGVCSTNSGMTVYRLDKNGLPLSIIPGTNDEFVYNAGSSNQSWPVDVSYNNTGATSDEGMHLFGNQNVNSGNPYFVEAYFSGEATCEVITQINQVDQSAVATSIVTYSTTSSLNPCFNVFVSSNSNSAYSPVCGPVPSIPTGSNLKQINGIKEAEFETHTVSSKPNPVKDLLTISVENETIINVELIDVLSRIKLEQTNENEQSYLVIDLRKLELPQGTYFVRTTTNKGTSIQKILITE
jgi:hypothetical protein